MGVDRGKMAGSEGERHTPYAGGGRRGRVKYPPWDADIINGQKIILTDGELGGGKYTRSARTRGNGQKNI